MKYLIALFISTISLTNADEFYRPHVYELTQDNYDELVKDSDIPWFVMFTAPWCIICNEIDAPMIQRVAQSL